MGIVDLLLLGGVFTALYTVVFLSKLITRDGGMAFGMFLGGTALTVIQIAYWACYH